MIPAINLMIEIKVFGFHSGRTANSAILQVVQSCDSISYDTRFQAFKLLLLEVDESLHVLSWCRTSERLRTNSSFSSTRELDTKSTLSTWKETI